MATVRRQIAEEYASALQNYLAGGGESTLHSAYQIGRDALDRGLGVLDMAAMHQDAVVAMFGERSGEMDGDTGHQLELANGFFVESLSPFELFHLASQANNAALRRLNMLMESEAKRIAHALHDEAAQLLATVYLELSEVARESPPSVQTRVGRIRKHLDEVREQLRRISHELRPLILDQLGLVPALCFLADGVGARANIPVTVEGSTEGRLSEIVETAVYRVVQEALANVTKHASPTRVNVRVWLDRGMLHCSIEDDGVGFNPAAQFEPSTRSGIGLIGIKERIEALHGGFEIVSAPGEGTVIHVSLPEERRATNATGTG